MSRLFLGIAILIAARGGVVRADDQSDATAILDAAINAHGGEAALGKFVGYYGKDKATSDDNGTTSVTFYESWFTPDKERTVTFDRDNVRTEIEVVTGAEGWTSTLDGSAEKMGAELLTSKQDMIYMSWVTTTFVPLKGKQYTLSVLDETDVAGHKAVGILVRREKHVPLKLYFDKETHLLAKLQCKVKDVEPGKTTEYDQECIFSDYRDLQGTKQPFKFEQILDGAKVGDYVIQELKLYDKPLDEKLFVKP